MTLAELHAQLRDSPRMILGPGDRDADCPHYSVCLDAALRVTWGKNPRSNPELHCAAACCWKAAP